MEKELDLSIAQFLKEQWEKEEQEKREKVRRQFDPKEQITYTLEQLKEGICSGRQYLYTLLLEFETKEILTEHFKIPYIKNFYDAEQEDAAMLFLASNKRSVVFQIYQTPCTQINASLEEWIEKMKEGMKDIQLSIKPTKKAAVGNVEYFCYTAFTAKGQLFNIAFRMLKDGQLYVGSLNCPKEEKGMSLLLEAMVCVIEEWNR